VKSAGDGRKPVSCRKTRDKRRPACGISATGRLTVALNMCVWHICTHTANQMTVQRYFSTSNAAAARRSFVTASLAGVFLNLMLMVAGLAVLYFYFGQDVAIEKGLDVSVKKDRDLIFPTFATHHLPPGVGGGILAALLAAAMSSIDSGVNSIATVLSVESQRLSGKSRRSGSHVLQAQIITLLAGVFITCAAYGLNFLPGKWGIVDSMPRTFNAVTAPLGGLFLVGMFLPRAGGRAAFIATLCGLATSIGIGYFDVYMQKLLEGGLLSPATLSAWGLLAQDGVRVVSLSFAWVMPSALLVTFVMAMLLSPLDRMKGKPRPGLTWWNRKEPSPLTAAISDER